MGRACLRLLDAATRPVFWIEWNDIEWDWPEPWQPEPVPFNWRLDPIGNLGWPVVTP